jgi:hypothetical protein
MWRVAECLSGVDECGRRSPDASLARRRHFLPHAHTLCTGEARVAPSASILNIFYPNSGMAPDLPDDILHLLCEELAAQDQFDTLFNCACSSRVLAVPALTHLYRYLTDTHRGTVATNFLRSHHHAPVRGGGEDLYGLPPATKLLTIQRWSILWRSIIASALDATLFPYCRYIRSLDFRDLEHLLDDDQFRAKVAK